MSCYYTHIDPLLRRAMRDICDNQAPWVKALREWVGIARDMDCGVSTQGQMLIRSLLQRAYGLSFAEVPGEVPMILWSFLESGCDESTTEQDVARFVIPALEGQFFAATCGQFEEEDFFPPLHWVVPSPPPLLVGEGGVAPCCDDNNDDKAGGGGGSTHTLASKSNGKSRMRFPFAAKRRGPCSCAALPASGHTAAFSEPLLLAMDQQQHHHCGKRKLHASSCHHHDDEGLSVQEMEAMMAA
eukprot:58861-Rhodomonas_salina.1